jgi:hypothetical protein
MSKPDAAITYRSTPGAVVLDFGLGLKREGAYAEADDHLDRRGQRGTAPTGAGAPRGEILGVSRCLPIRHAPGNALTEKTSRDKLRITHRF